MFDLKRPCVTCPFRAGQGSLFQIHPNRLEEIRRASAFQCHKTIHYGTGEYVVLSALKGFFECCTRSEVFGYDYRDLETRLGAPVAWLMINALCHAGIIDYGTSPRGGWLAPEGQRLKAFVDQHTAIELDAMTDQGDDYIHCGRTYCNCQKTVEGGFQSVEGPCRENPFWCSGT